MSDHVGPCTDDERSTTTHCSLTMDDKSDEQLSSTLEFKTDDDAQQLPSTMEIHMDSAGDYNTEIDGAASITAYCTHPLLLFLADNLKIKPS